MESQSATAELDACRYLYLSRITERETNCLLLLISEGIVSERIETFRLGTVEIPGARSIDITEDSRHFEVSWDTYISYAVRNESYCAWDKTEEWTGENFRMYSKSTFLDFVAHGTFATSEYPGPFVHYQIICSDHIIDVVSETRPKVRRVDA